MGRVWYAYWYKKLHRHIPVDQERKVLILQKDMPPSTSCLRWWKLISEADRSASRKRANFHLSRLELPQFHFLEEHSSHDTVLYTPLIGIFKRNVQKTCPKHSRMPASDRVTLMDFFISLTFFFYKKQIKEACSSCLGTLRGIHRWIHICSRRMSLAELFQATNHRLY